MIQAEAGNQYGHPKPSVIRRLKQAGVTMIYRTDRDGTIVVHSDGSRLEVETDK